MSQRIVTTEIPLGIGYYTVPEAARLLRIPPVNIRRWLGGYSFVTREGAHREMLPLWTPQLPAHERQIELGFRDLIELRFVSAFLDSGLRISTIRRCLVEARRIVGDQRPFSTRRFRTDGKTIFVELVAQIHESANDNPTDFSTEELKGLIDLKNQQYVFRDVVTQTFRDLDLDEDTVVRWRPFRSKSSIVIDPKRAFGQPIAAEAGVPTSTLADAVSAEGSERRVASLFNVPRTVVHDAVLFENGLAAA
jgi:uncharacterized protein (DUF433 family)